MHGPTNMKLMSVLEGLRKNVKNLRVIGKSTFGTVYSLKNDIQMNPQVNNMRLLGWLNWFSRWVRSGGGNECKGSILLYQ